MLEASLAEHRLRAGGSAASLGVAQAGCRCVPVTGQLRKRKGDFQHPADWGVSAIALAQGWHI